ncbi:MAG TPA: right-handed parallel beta-helix repeat-containing protein [Gemmatimonadaceae bacterium]|nr:right-handed parallel beta-helix repeat-containing protein [Gemmatimonadaceae bacterium]
MTLDRRSFLAMGSGALGLPAGLFEPQRESAPANCCGLTVNVRTAPYSAAGDGKANDTAAITAALNAVAAAGGGVVDIPAGVYLVDTIRIPRARGGTIRIVGQGWSYDTGATTKFISASANPMFVPDGGANGIELSLVHLDGNNIGTHGWYGEAGNKTRLLNVLVDRFAKYGVYFNQGLCELRQSYVRFNRGVGVRTSSDGWYSGNEIGSNGGAGLIVAGGGNRITDNLINSNGSYGIHITGKPANNLINSIIGGYLGENVGQNIMIEGESAANRNVGYNSIIGCFIQQVTEKRAGGIGVRNARQTQIMGINYLGGAFDTGCIQMHSCDSSQIVGVASSYSSGNIVRLSGCDDVSVSSITSRDHASAKTTVDDSYAVRIDDSCHRCSVTDLRITDARGKAFSRGVKNQGVGTVILGAYTFSGASNPDSFGDAAVMTYEVQAGRWRMQPK